MDRLLIFYESMVARTSTGKKHPLIFALLLIGGVGTADSFPIPLTRQNLLLLHQSAHRPIRPEFTAINLRSQTMSSLAATESQETTTENNKTQVEGFQELDQSREETLDEIQLRGLWDKDPFKTATALVQSIVSSPDLSVSTAVKLRIIATTEDDTTQHSAPLTTNYQEMFERALVFAPITNNQAAAVAAVAVPDDKNDTVTNISSDNENSKDEDQKGFYSFRMEIAYMGESFCGWQTQPHNQQRPSVQQTLEDWLQPMFEPSRRTKKYIEQQKANEKLPLHPKAPKRPKKEIKEPRVNIRVAGRTDAGVHAIGQVTRFRTWTKGGGASTFQLSKDNNNDNISMIAVDEAQSPSDQLRNFINQHPLAGNAFRCLSVSPISSKFHPTFGASCRAYLYLIDASSIITMLKARSSDTVPSLSLEQLTQQLNTMLGALEGQELDYVAMSYGKIKTQNTLCKLQVARAFSVESTEEEEGSTKGRAVCIQLVGDRFLRRMVRILVATALRESLVACDASASPPDNRLKDEGDRSNPTSSLVRILESKDRTMTARPAPPQGLIFTSAAFE